MPRLVSSLPRAPSILIGLSILLLLANDALDDNPYFDADTVGLILSIAIGGTALMTAAAHVLNRRLVVRSWPRLALGLLVSVVVSGVAVVAAEFATRWIYRDITTTSDDRGYFSHRWLRSGAVSYDRHGFRERDFADRKAAGTVRIGVLGDSFAFGNGIPAGQRFSALLQQSLPARMEVLNFGIAGNNSREHVTALRRVLPFDPDFVLLQWFVNDVEGDDRDRPPVTPLVPYRRVHDWLHESSALYTFLDTWWTRRQVLGMGAGSNASYLKARYGDPQGEAVRLDRAAMRSLASEARDAGVGLGVVLFPDTGYDLGPSYPFEFLHARMREFCAEQGITCLDLRPEFAAVKRRESLWANPLDTHPSSVANMIAATRILQIFQPRWLDLPVAR